MSYPQPVIDQVVNHGAAVDPDTDEELRAAYSETVEAHSVIEVELASGQDYLIHIEDIETVLAEIEQPMDANGNPTVRLGAKIGSWCIKTLGGEPVYGLLTSEDRSGRCVCRLHQSQLDRLKALRTSVFRDKTRGTILDAVQTAAIA